MGTRGLRQGASAVCRGTRVDVTTDTLNDLPCRRSESSSVADIVSIDFLKQVSVRVLVPLKLWATNCSPAGRAVCATIGADAIEWPVATPGVHLHLSPPCTSLSKARAGSASASSVTSALDAVRWCVQLVLDNGFASWSLENVSTPGVVACVAELARQHPDRVAYLTLDAADYGVASNRVRLIASTPAVIRALKELPVARVSVGDAFAAAGLPLPAQYLKSNTSNRGGTPCVRSTQQPAFAITASHPLIWCTRAGATVRCLTVAESAVLMGFPLGWHLPKGSRAGLRAVGNAVPPTLAHRPRSRRAPPTTRSAPRRHAPTHTHTSAPVIKRHSLF